MKENKGKGLVNKEAVQGGENIQTQPHPATSEKRTTLSMTIDIRSLPNRQARERVKLEDETKELKNLIEELKADASRRIPALTISKKEATSFALFLARLKK